MENTSLEVWRICNDYPEYEVSNQGRIRRHDNHKILKLISKAENEYQRVHLRSGVENPNGAYVRVHRLVAQAFVPNPTPDIRTFIDHIDRNVNNNNATNLRWVTKEENEANKDRSQRHSSVFWDRVPIVLTDRDTGEFIQEYKSVEEAGNSLGLSFKCIVADIYKKRRPFLIGHFVLKSDYLQQKN